ncbi:hypothetical protein FHG89_32060 [Micromonospora orduensis]|uniref:Catalase n=1 Tax=Micromonospora orduensis TaxID=1420891 RepID=A0A5C4QFX8_9ACTN|nr:hypothetical protein [Micromonospora orduensis]TNH21217.1 hypothetical protein FHG89_32060 [Micromonospora orduensis]
MSESPAGKPTLTTRQGHPVHNNQQQRTVGSRGPATLEKMVWHLRQCDESYGRRVAEGLGIADNA